jgi:hypothetical protein
MICWSFSGCYMDDFVLGVRLVYRTVVYSDFLSARRSQFFRVFLSCLIFYNASLCDTKNEMRK